MFEAYLFILIFLKFLIIISIKAAFLKRALIIILKAILPFIYEGCRDLDFRLSLTRSIIKLNSY